MFPNSLLFRAVSEHSELLPWHNLLPTEVSITSFVLRNNNIESHQSLKSTCLENEKRHFIRAILKKGNSSRKKTENEAHYEFIKSAYALHCKN